jgi:hypothetical protein
MGVKLGFGEEHRVRVSENRVMRRVFRPKMEEGTGRGRKLHNVICTLLQV